MYFQFEFIFEIHFKSNFVNFHFFTLHLYIKFKFSCESSFEIFLITWIFNNMIKSYFKEKYNIIILIRN